MKITFVRYLLGSMLLLSLVACGAAELPADQSSATPVPAASATPESQSAGAPKIGASHTVLTIRTNGGLCTYGPCWSEKQIRPDGSYHAEDGTGAKKDGTLDEAQVMELTQLIAAANFEEIRSHSFVGTCPIAFDGQEFVYTFQTMSGPETIASCQVAIDENSPLFKHIATLIETINQA